jgi:hypothetical protein
VRGPRLGDGDEDEDGGRGGQLAGPERAGGQRGRGRERGIRQLGEGTWPGAAARGWGIGLRGRPSRGDSPVGCSYSVSRGDASEVGEGALGGRRPGPRA